MDGGGCNGGLELYKRDERYEKRIECIKEENIQKGGLKMIDESESWNEDEEWGSEEIITSFSISTSAYGEEVNMTWKELLLEEEESCRNNRDICEKVQETTMFPIITTEEVEEKTSKETIGVKTKDRVSLVTGLSGALLMVLIAKYGFKKKEPIIQNHPSWQEDQPIQPIIIPKKNKSDRVRRFNRHRFKSRIQ